MKEDEATRERNLEAGCGYPPWSFGSGLSR
jgi:hypothetical protein